MIDKINYLLIMAATKPKITPGTRSDQVNIPKIDSNTVFNNLINFIYWGAGIAAVLVIIIAGIIFATSEGQSEKIIRARKMIQYTVVGLIVILMAASITQFVIGRF